MRILPIALASAALLSAQPAVACFDALPNTAKVSTADLSAAAKKAAPIMAVKKKKTKKEKVEYMRIAN